MFLGFALFKRFKWHFGEFLKRETQISPFVNIKGVAYARRERRYPVITDTKDILSVS